MCVNCSQVIGCFLFFTPQHTHFLSIISSGEKATHTSIYVLTKEGISSSIYPVAKSAPGSGDDTIEIVAMSNS